MNPRCAGDMLFNCQGTSFGQWSKNVSPTTLTMAYKVLVKFYVCGTRFKYF